jgi:hypothetical protein
VYDPEDLDAFFAARSVYTRDTGPLPRHR